MPSGPVVMHHVVPVPVPSLPRFLSSPVAGSNTDTSRSMAKKTRPSEAVMAHALPLPGYGAVRRRARVVRSISARSPRTAV
jgi:hypothetical protein